MKTVVRMLGCGAVAMTLLLGGSASAAPGFGPIGIGVKLQPFQTFKEAYLALGTAVKVFGKRTILQNATSLQNYANRFTGSPFDGSDFTKVVAKLKLLAKDKGLDTVKFAAAYSKAANTLFPGFGDKMAEKYGDIADVELATANWGIDTLARLLVQFMDTASKASRKKIGRQQIVSPVRKGAPKLSRPAPVQQQ